jgi:hypothetical protein
MVAKMLSLFLPENQGIERGVAQEEAGKLLDAAGGVVYEVVKTHSTWKPMSMFTSTLMNLFPGLNNRSLVEERQALKICLPALGPPNFSSSLHITFSIHSTVSFLFAAHNTASSAVRWHVGIGNPDSTTFKWTTVANFGLQTHCCHGDQLINDWNY